MAKDEQTKRGLTIGVVIALIALVAGCFGAWASLYGDVRENSVKVAGIEKALDEIKANCGEILDKLEKIDRQVIAIQCEIEKNNK